MELWVAITILASAALGAWSGYAKFVKEIGKEKAREVPDINEVNRLMALAEVRKLGRENWGTEEIRALYDRKWLMIVETTCFFAGAAALILIVLLALGAGYNEYSE